jgi:hypothetical protein
MPRKRKSQQRANLGHLQKGAKMDIQTKYNIGDHIECEGVRYKIRSAHIYESEKKHTERYYLGDKKWITIKFEKEVIEK